MTAESTASAEPPDPTLISRNAVGQALGALSTLVPVGLFGADPDGSCWYVNQRLIDSLGIEVPSGDEARFHLDIPPGHIPSEGVFRLGVAATVEDIGTGLDSDSPWSLDAQVMPLVSRAGNIVSYIGVVVDVDATDVHAKALRTSERLVDALIDHSPDVMTILNADGSWRYSNAAAWRLLGFQTDFDPVNGILALIHPDDAPEAAEAIEKLRQGEPLGKNPIEVRVRAADGSWRYLENVVENLLDDPVVHGFLLRSHDVTERRQVRMALLEANERLSTLISSLHLAVLMENAEREIIFTNDAFVSLFEMPIPAEELIGHTVADLGAEFFRRFGDPTSTPVPGQLDEPLGTRRPALGERLELMDNRVLERDYLPVIADGEHRGHVWVFRDVSAQAWAEAEWESLIARQRHENERLVEMDRVKAAFLAEISHELRTPLTSILSFTELLAEGLGKDDPVEQAEFLEIIKRNADRLLRLVDDLLLLDRLETGAMPLEWGIVDVPSLVSSCVSSFAPAAEAKSISLVCEIGEGPMIPGDEGRLAQVVDVLLSNAIKFTPEGGRILVAASPRDHLWRVEVVDNGMGVPAREQESLFERFYRASNARSSRIGGSGLGLPVAQAIIELHRGGIALRSAEGAGTTVVVTLPFRTESGTDEDADTDE
ncbi:MAG: PAS domain-containing sensor histidine kinase [Acidimicrobiales bacterium]